MTRAPLGVAFVCAVFVAAALAAAPSPAAAQTWYGCTWPSGSQPANEAMPTTNTNMTEIIPFADALAPASGGGLKIAAASGAWSAGGTWGGTAPTNGQAVFIPQGIKVQLDNQMATGTILKYVRIEGCLEFKNTVSTRLNAKFIYVAPAGNGKAGGELWIGSASNRIAAASKAEIVFPNTPLDGTDTARLGNGLVAASRVTMAGAAKTPKFRLPGQTGLAASQSSYTFASGIPPGWRASDYIVITGMKYKWPNSTTHNAAYTDCNGHSVTLNYKTNHGGKVYSEDELIQMSIAPTPANTISFSQPLVYAHAAVQPFTTPPTERTLTPYMINLTRNVRISTLVPVATTSPNLPASESTFVTRQDVLDKRGHVMFLSPQTKIDSVEFAQLGRTDKMRRAHMTSNSCSQTGPAASAEPRNVKGRYPVHIHHAFASTTNVAEIQNSSVWMSPGWAFAQHDSEANLFGNVSFDIFGAAFVTESGSEKGVWFNNAAVRSSGLDQGSPPKNSVRGFSSCTACNSTPYADYDIARTGHGFWLHGRMVHVKENFAANVARSGFSFLHRQTDLPSRDIITGKDLLQPVSMRFYGAATSKKHDFDRVNIQNFSDNEAMGSYVGLEVMKDKAFQPHDLRSVIDRFWGWEISQSGIQLEYTAHYTIRGARLARAVNPRTNSTATGSLFGVNAYDLAIVDSKILNFPTGLEFRHESSITAGNDNPDGYFASVNNVITGSTTRCRTLSGPGCLIANDVEQNPPFAISAQPPSLALTPPAATNSWCKNGPANFAPCWDSASSTLLHINGDKTDSISAQFAPNPFPFSTAIDRIANNSPLDDNETFIDIDALKGVVTKEGFYRQNSDLFVLWPEYVADRLTGNVILTVHPIGIDRRCDNSTTCGNFTPTGRFLGDPHLANPTTPTAINDSATIQKSLGAQTIDVLANDTMNLGCPINPTATDIRCIRRDSGLTAARYGSVRWSPEFDPANYALKPQIVYTPHPGLPSTATSDSFEYWVRNGDGRPAKAAVSVTLQ